MLFRDAGVEPVEDLECSQEGALDEAPGAREERDYDDEDEVDSDEEESVSDHEANLRIVARATAAAQFEMDLQGL